MFGLKTFIFYSSCEADTKICIHLTDFMTKTWDICPTHNITQTNRKKIDIADALRPTKLQLRTWILLVSDNAQILHSIHYVSIKITTLGNCKNFILVEKLL